MPENRFLFSGKSFLHSVLSNVGSVFSVTWLFGAIIIYSVIYRGLLVLIAAISFTLAYLTIRSILLKIKARFPVNKVNRGDSNLLLLFMSSSLGRAEYRIFLKLLALSYFTILTEELAVARLVLNSIFPEQYGVTSFLLFTICIVAYAYISIGGFKAVLNSDVLQGVALVTFMIVLVYRSSRIEAADLTVLPANILSWEWLVFSAAIWIIGLMAWLVTSVDSYTRLNIIASDSRIWLSRFRLVPISLISTLLVMCVGLLFGASAAPYFSDIASASRYVHELVSCFMGDTSALIRTCFLVSVFCMIFTTADTLLISMLQIGYHGNSRRISRDNLSTVFLAAIVLSVVIPHDSVSAVGIYVGSTLLLPFVAILRVLLPRSFCFLPQNLRYLIIALLLSLIVFSTFYHQLENNYKWHFMIPAIVAGSIIAAGLTWKLSDKLLRKGR